MCIYIYTCIYIYISEYMLVTEYSYLGVCILKQKPGTLERGPK